MRPPRILVVLPTVDEAETIEAVLEGVLAALPGGEVLVVDDASRDGTAEIAKRRAASHPRIHLIERPAKQGLGSAYIEGFRWGLEGGFELFVEMDADLSHDPAALPSLTGAADRGEVVIGSRFVPGGRVVDWPAWRLLLSRAGNLYSRTLLGFGIRDSTSGFRCYRREVLDSIGLDSVMSDGYGFQIEMAYRAWRLGASILEVPITFTERTGGKSKISRAIIGEALMSVAGWALRDRLLRRGGRAQTRGGRRSI